jgi:arylsulfatase
MDETTDIGTDSGTPVSEDHGAKHTAYNGTIKWVEIDLGDDPTDTDHLITPEERLRVAIARH